MDIKKNPPRTTGMANLIGVRSGQYYYVGKLGKRPEKPGLLPLEGAFELLVSNSPTAAGINQQIIPTWIAPFGGPTNIMVRVDALFDLSRVTDKGFHSMVRGMLGTSGVLLPSTSLVR